MSQKADPKNVASAQPAAKIEEKKAAPAQPVQPAAKPVEKKAAPTQPVQATQPAAKPEEKKAAPGKPAQATQPIQPAQPAAKPEEKKVVPGQPAQPVAKPEEKKVAPGQLSQHAAKTDEKKTVPSQPGQTAAKPEEGKKEEEKEVALSPELLRQKKEIDEKNRAEQTMIKGILAKLQITEEKINSGISDKTMVNARKDKEKVVKYGDQLTQMGKELEGAREKDPNVFQKQVKSEVEFALLRISEKRYKAEQESVKLIAILDKKKEHIRDIETRMREMKAENDKLKARNLELEEEVKHLAEGQPKKKTVGKATFNAQSPLQPDQEASQQDFHAQLEEREELLSQDPTQQIERKYDDEDAFWYQNETGGPRDQGVSGVGGLWVMNNESSFGQPSPNKAVSTKAISTKGKR